MNPLFWVALAFLVWSLMRVRKQKTLSSGLLAGFWFFFAIHLISRLPQFAGLAVLCIMGYWVARYRERRRTFQLLKALQEDLGISDETLESLSKESQEAEKLKREKEAVVLEKKERLAAEEKAYAARARPTFVPITGTLSTATTLAAEGGSFVVGPGPVQLEVRLKSAVVSETNYDISVCTRLVDNQGIVWEGESFMLVHSWLGSLDEEEYLFNFTGWASAPDEWKNAVADACQVAGIQVLMDSRVYHDLLIDGTKVPYFEKYQCPSVDISWVAGQGIWLVRVAGLRRDLRDDRTDPDDEGVIPPFCWTVDAAVASLPMHPDRHGVQAGDLLEETADGRKVVFHKTNRKAVAQPGIQFRVGG